mmetsp:Transcript_26201/g.59246  ORF Transcript_26201/g.59246 Transcript_26201/m.59246 type:complete len:271 (+) Transcript_26201:116-928(+)
MSESGRSRLSSSQPIAAQLRRRKEEGKAEEKEKVSLLSIEEQIAQLQRTLEEDSEDSGSEGSDGDSDSGTDGKTSNPPKRARGCLVETDAAGNVLRFVSSIQESERIAPLPSHLLPSARCKFGGSGSGLSDEQDKKRKVQFGGDDAAAAAAAAAAIKLSGMERTVRELLAAYAPLQGEKRPFYCRICAHQASDLASFEAHKGGEFHAVAVRVELAHRTCKHCEKEFTSVEQLKEHIKGKAHKDKVAWLSNRKRGSYTISYSAPPKTFAKT